MLSAPARRRPAGPRSGRGGPTSTTSSWAPARQASVRPSSSAPHSARFVAAIAAGELRAIVSASACAASRSRSGGSTTSAEDAELAGPLGGDALVAADERHADDRLHRRLPHQGDGLVGASPGRSTRGGRGTWRRSAAITMSASATKCSPPPAHMPLTAAITGFHTSLCQAVRRSSARLVRRDCSRSASGSRPSWATSSPVWNAGPLPVLTMTRTVGVGVELAPRRARARRASWRPWRCRRSGRSKTSQPTGPAPLDDERLVAVRAASRPRARRCHGASRQGSGSRGRPRTRSPTMFLFTSVVPPSIVLARLRSIPATS